MFLYPLSFILVFGQIDGDWLLKNQIQLKKHELGELQWKDERQGPLQACSQTGKDNTWVVYHCDDNDDDNGEEYDHSRNMTTTQLVREVLKPRSGFLIKIKMVSC